MEGASIIIIRQIKRCGKKYFHMTSIDIDILTSLRYNVINNDLEVIMANSRDNVYVVVHRRLDEEEDIVQLVPRLYIMEVPDEIDVQQIKHLLESAGLFHREQWREYRLYNPDELTVTAGVLYQSDDSESIDYDTLMSKAQEEKRITLRLPIGLYTALVREAKYVSFNQHCINLLSNAIKFGDYSTKLQDK